MLRPPAPVPDALEAAAAAAANDNAGDANASSDGERVILSRKEHARFLRQQAYRRAKEWRAKDPRHLAMKEAAKLRRRELYQQVKQKRKSAEAEAKAKDKSRRTLQRSEERAEAGRTLVKAVRGLR